MNPRSLFISDINVIGFDVIKIDFNDIVSACMLSSKSESESICFMVFFISTFSYTPGGSCFQRNRFQFEREEYLSRDSLWNFVDL